MSIRTEAIITYTWHNGGTGEASGAGGLVGWLTRETWNVIADPGTYIPGAVNWMQEHGIFTGPVDFADALGVTPEQLNDTMTQYGSSEAAYGDFSAYSGF